MARPKNREQYHHGDLKRALLDAATQLIAEGGMDHFTMAKAARRAGVSSGAPYRHFPDRRTLLAHLAQDSAADLDQAVDEALDAADPEPLEQLLAVGEAHVRFALAHPAQYRVMHAPEYLDEDEEAREEVGANDRVLSATARGSREAAVRLAAQATIYGLSRMLVDGHFAQGTDPDVAVDAIRQLLSAISHR